MFRFRAPRHRPDTSRNWIEPICDIAAVDGIQSTTSHPQRGALMIEPIITIDGHNQLLDHALGAGFALLMNHHPVESRELRWFRRELGGRVVMFGDDSGYPVVNDTVVQDHTGALHDWFSRTGATAVLIRPDRHIFGIADQKLDTTRLLADLRAKLQRTA